MCLVRFTNDLLLWEPASPAAVEKASARSMFYSCMDLLQPAVTHHEKFKLCKSVLEDGEIRGEVREGYDRVERRLCGRRVRRKMKEG